MNLKGKIINTSGFTLVELMITMVISGIIVGGIYSAYMAQQRTYNAQEQVAEMQQNIRAAVMLISRDMRMAGYDPSGAGSFGFVDNTSPPPPPPQTLFSNGASQNETVYTSSTRISFTADLDNDGTIDRVTEDINGDTNTDMTEMEQVAYRLNGTDFERYSTLTGFIEWQDVAENIEAIEFNYILDDGTTTVTPAASSDLDNIRSIQISILARAGQPDRQFTNTMTYTTASGATWGPYNDNDRRRLLITTVNCRNMGL